MDSARRCPSSFPSFAKVPRDIQLMHGFRPLLNLSRRSKTEPWVCPSCRANAVTHPRRKLHRSRIVQAGVNQIPVALADEDLLDLPSDLMSLQPHVETFTEAPSPSARPQRQTLAKPPPVRLSLGALLRKPVWQLQTATDGGINMERSIAESLQAGRPSEIVAKLAQASAEPELLQSIPGTTWTEIIRHLNPKTWTPQMPSVHRSVNVERMFRGTHQSPSISARAHLKTLTEVIRIRKAAGIPIELADYRMLLEYASRMCSFRMAQSIWRDMTTDGVALDLDCYNALMEASLYDSGQRLRLGRGARASSKARGEDGLLWNPGISSAVEQIFEHVTRDKSIQPDTRSYCCLLIALSRDLKSREIAKVLDDQWGLDVRAIASGKDVQQPKEYAKGHQLYPDSRLLVTIADAFGAHNGITPAFRLIDTISSHYGIPVKRNVWHQLLMWTWLHGQRQRTEIRQRCRELRERSNSSSQLFEAEDEAESPSLTPLEERQRRRDFNARFDALFETMLSSPNSSLKPTLHMLHMATSVTQGSHAQGTPGYTAPANAGKELLNQLIELQRSARVRADTLLAQQRRPGRVRSPITASHALQSAAATKMDTRIAISYMQRWAKRIIETGVPDNAVAHMDEPEADRLERWRIEGLPLFLAEWRSVVPSQVRYQVPGGIVHLHFRTAAEAEARRQARERFSLGPRSPRMLKRARKRRRLESSRLRVGMHFARTISGHGQPTGLAAAG